MTELLEDVRHASRRFRKSPGFTAVAVLTLALGIGANSALFSVVHEVLLRPLPYKDPDSLVMVWQQNPHRGWLENAVSGANFRDWQKQNHVFADMAAFESLSFNLTGDAKPEEIAGERVTANLFSLLDVQPLHGRLFLPEEERTEKAAVLISYQLWQQHYGGDPSVVGRRISLNGESYPIVGILPASFADDYSASSAPHSLIWISGIEPFPENREFHEYRALARLKPAVSLAQAQAEMDTIAGGIERHYPESRGWRVALVGLHDQVVHYTRPALLLLLGAAALILLIACANVANLLLVRATGRERETAIRSALGASRGRIIRQFLVESTLLSFWGASAGLAPAFSASNPNMNESLKESGRGSTVGAKRHRLRDGLVVCEFALALALLVGAGVMIKALAHLHGVDIGFNPDHLLSLKIPLEGPAYRAAERQAGFFEQLLSRIEALPGVEAASIPSASV